MAAPVDFRTVVDMTALTAAATLLTLSSAHVPARALQVIAELGVADHLDEEPCSADELALAVGADADAIGRLLRLLESHGIFKRGTPGTWCHTESSRLLRTDHPESLRAFVRMSYSGFSWGAVTHLAHAVRTGDAGISQLDSGGWTSYLRAHPNESETFQEAMTAKAHDDVDALLCAYDFSRHDCIADIGGGEGLLITSVLSANPTARGVLFDLREVASRAKGVDRLDVVAGDFFVDPLPRADAYVLMNIIHDWDDTRARAILEAVGSAGRSGRATVLLLEVVMPETEEPHWAKTLDVMMLAITGGRERTLSEYNQLLTSAGMELVQMTPTNTPFSIVEARITDPARSSI